MHFEPLPISSVIGAFLIGFPALFSIVNPIGGALIFYNMTTDRTHAQRFALARRVAINAALVLIGSLWLGSYILNIFGVSLGALRVAGGLVVAATAWGLLMQPDPAIDQVKADAERAAPHDGIAFFPLTVPITTGPGSIAVAIALASERPPAGEGIWTFFSGLTAAALANAILVWVFYVFADLILVRLGQTGARTVSRLSAFLLLCIGVQIITTGAESLLTPWLEHSIHP